MKAARHVLIWSHVLLLVAAPLGFAATFNVPPDALPPRLDVGDILNFGPGVSTIGDPNERRLFNTFPNQGISPGVTINVLGGQFGGFESRSGPEIREGSVLNLHDGFLGGQSSSLLGGVWNIRGGEVYGGWHMQGGTLNIEGGFVDRGVSNGGQINLRGGTLRAGPVFHTGTASLPLQINVSGGAIVPFDAFPMRLSGQVELNIRGGRILSGLHLAPTPIPAPVVNLFVKSAALDGLAITGLVPGVPHKVLERDMTLVGELADGNPFSFNLNSTTRQFVFTLYPNSSTINVILVPEFPPRAAAALFTSLAVFLRLADRPSRNGYPGVFAHSVHS
jgi:hypothetical protein